MAVEWDAVDPDTGDGEPELRDVEVVDAVNRFARHASIECFDDDGTKVAEYPDYSLVDLEVAEGGDPLQRRLSGFVVEQAWGQDFTEIDLLSHDHWLKRRKVYDRYEDVAPVDLLQDLIDRYVPLEWDASRVEIVDPPGPITRTFKGETVATIIDDVAKASDREQFGATNDRVFFFEPLRAGEADVSFTPGRYVATDWEDDSRGEFNQVTVYYDDGNAAVSVDDKAAQQELADEIGATDPVVLERTRTYDGIEDEATARAQAESILRGGDPIQVGEIETWGALDLRPGQVVTVVDPEADVDGEFRVAEVRYEWTADRTYVTVAENREGVEDVLGQLSEDHDRVEARPASVDATITDFIPVEQLVDVDLAVTVREQRFRNDVFRFGDFGQPIGPAGVGGPLGDGLAAREVIYEHD